MADTVSDLGGMVNLGSSESDAVPESVWKEDPNAYYTSVTGGHGLYLSYGDTMHGQNVTGEYMNKIENVITVQLAKDGFNPAPETGYGKLLTDDWTKLNTADVFKAYKNSRTYCALAFSQLGQAGDLECFSAQQYASQTKALQPFVQAIDTTYPKNIGTYAIGGLSTGNGGTPGYQVATVQIFQFSNNYTSSSITGITGTAAAFFYRHNNENWQLVPQNADNGGNGSAPSCSDIPKSNQDALLAWKGLCS
jgi:hypothetical protein